MLIQLAGPDHPAIVIRVLHSSCDPLSRRGTKDPGSMKNSDSDDTQSLEPRLSPAECDEVAHIGYFLDQWKGLRARGIITYELYVQVVGEYNGRRAAIERRGQYQAAMYYA